MVTKTRKFKKYQAIYQDYTCIIDEDFPDIGWML